VQREKDLIAQQAAALRSADSERQAATAAQITTTLAEWTKLEAAARLNLTDMVQREKKLFEQQAVALRTADSERHTSAATQIATALAEWTRLESNARQSLADMMQQEQELFEHQVATLRTTDNERHAAATAQIATALAEWTKIEGGRPPESRRHAATEKKLFEQQVVALRSAENDRVAAAAEEITMTLASWTGIEAGVRRQITAAARSADGAQGHALGARWQDRGSSDRGGIGREGGGIHPCRPGLRPHQLSFFRRRRRRKSRRSWPPPSR